jgi:NAD(P)H-nitrite reductase large subunit
MPWSIVSFRHEASKYWKKKQGKVMEIVIIGNSAAAVGAVEAIRKKDRAVPITIISDDPHPVYSRPLISYLLSGEIKLDRIFFRPKNFYEKNDVRALLGNCVVNVNFEKKAIQLEDGKKIPYDRLLIATGGKPFLPKMEGLNTPGVYTFTKLEDAGKISSALKEARKAVVIGGGLIGLKAAGALKKRNVEVTIVELADHILSLTLDGTASSILERALKKEGFHLITSNTAEAILGDGRVESVRLADGRLIKTQLVVVAIGVNPNVQIFRGTPLQIEKGIVVNERMETNLPDIYAAGDVVQAYDRILESYRTLPIWPNAYVQGKVAGYQMVGEDQFKYDGSFMMNSIEVAHIPTISIGLANPPSEDGYQVMKRLDRVGGVYRKIILKEDRVVGAIFAGQIDRAGIMTGLLRDKINVKGFKKDLLSDRFGLISLPKALRKEKLSNRR